MTREWDPDLNRDHQILARHVTDPYDDGAIVEVWLGDELDGQELSAPQCRALIAWLQAAVEAAP